ncbi:MAG: hypothetical protein ABSF18_03700 [Gammaproteobacteria bacterium]|jgi:hypothetical protein
MQLSHNELLQYFQLPLTEENARAIIHYWNTNHEAFSKLRNDLKPPREINEICLAIRVLMIFAASNTGRAPNSCTAARIFSIAIVTDTDEATLFLALSKIYFQLSPNEYKATFFQVLYSIEDFFNPEVKQHIQATCMSFREWVDMQQAIMSFNRAIELFYHPFIFARSWIQLSTVSFNAEIARENSTASDDNFDERSLGMGSPRVTVEQPEDTQATEKLLVSSSRPASPVISFFSTPVEETVVGPPRSLPDNNLEVYQDEIIQPHRI